MNRRGWLKLLPAAPFEAVNWTTITSSFYAGGTKWMGKP